MIKNIFHTLAALICLAAAFVSCTSDDFLNQTETKTPANTRTITVNLIPAATRTTLDDDAKLHWKVGDEVSYFTKYSRSTKARINAANGSFYATIPVGDYRIKVVYPAVPDGMEYNVFMKTVPINQTYGSSLPLPMKTDESTIPEGAQFVNAEYTVYGAVVKVTVKGIDAANIKAVRLGKYKCEVPDGQTSDGTFFVVLPLDQAEFTPSVLVNEGGKNKTFRYKNCKIQDFTAKGYTMEIDLSNSSDYVTYYEDEIVYDDETKLSGKLNGHEFVDLDLPSGKLWATCNVGSNNIDDNGNYYVWGETETKDYYDEHTIVWYGRGSATYLYRYGFIDWYEKLTPDHDAAHVHWGAYWKMPDNDDFEELLKNCNWTWTTQNGIKGYLVSSKTNGKSIFLAVCGRKFNSKIVDKDYGFYLSSTYEAIDYWFSALEFNGDVKTIWGTAHKGEVMTLPQEGEGLCVRPVFVDPAKKIYQLKVSSYPESVASISVSPEAKDNKYQEGLRITVTAEQTTLDGFNFVNWTDKSGNILSTEASFTFNISEDTEQLWANYTLPGYTNTIPYSSDLSFLWKAGTFSNCRYDDRCISYGSAGAYAEYDLNNTKTTSYNLSIKCSNATNEGRKVRIDITNSTGNVFSQEITPTRSSAWDDFTGPYTVNIPNLQQGNSKLRVTMVGGAVNFKDIDFKEQ